MKSFQRTWAVCDGVDVSLLITHWGREKMVVISSIDIFKCIFLNEKIFISIKISLKFVAEWPVDNKAALVQMMAWRRIGDKPLSEPMMAWLTDASMRPSGSMRYHPMRQTWYNIIITVEKSSSLKQWYRIIKRDKIPSTTIGFVSGYTEDAVNSLRPSDAYMRR